ncbi:ABC transporter ATP-binding protein [Virgibacillus necropolis]|uniref:Molybdenum ABC transporter ATP-binding protein n=1 Tax=Virgibacillus necropolis TaxID=163877 RepID=A0A221MCR0_9BACI|nr:ABC transporter ATP-binding protein [Virgibacillus necropolis]ASN05433.1 molybdenum ABC transporter ATP-binding protein [Virgibacillus necropolis]
MTKVIDIKDVSWERQKKTILSDLHWEVSKGEHWAVLGLNGSGKTTLLNMVNGYVWPTTGSVSVLKQPFGKTDIRELRKSIGWVSSSLQERIKGTEYAEDIVVSGKYASIGLYENPTEVDSQKAYQIMEQVGCSHLIGHTYQICSQGEKQKVLIARGLMGSPELLILDEPSNGLDFISREELMSTINQVAMKKDAPTIIFVTHHIEEILPVFTHTLLLRDGTVFDSGKRHEVLTSECLSRFFKKPVKIEWHKERPWMVLRD